MSASARRIASPRAAITLDGSARGLLYLLPLAVAFGSLAPLGVGSLRAGVTDLIVAAQVALGVVWLWRSPGARADLAHPVAWAQRLWRSEPQALALLLALAAYLAVI
ncbi:MAG TPA: hypothetical protein VIG77_08625, partial [Ktedonobacterales bacterium]